MAADNRFRVLPDGIEWRGAHEVVVLRGWGTDGVRVQAAIGDVHPGLPGALLEDVPEATAEVALDGNSATVTNGTTRACVWRRTGRCTS